ncbi:MAG: family 43 glycosylhydrolase [Bacteroidales bacterium]|nr:family 43 glycosylhydrolase [Bacteroidales bacterium]
MKARISLIIAAAFISVAASAQIGKPFIHDPSTIAECDGKYYTFGTGSGGLISEDGWTWNSGAVRPGGGAAPDVVKIGDRYLVGYSATGGGLGGGHAGRILVMWNNTLDPNSPDFKYSDPIEVAHSEVDEDCDAIDIGLFLDPVTGRLWATYGTYFGAIRMVELDPKTGERVKGNVEKDVAVDCEASDLIYHNGWYYLLGTHGTCCDGTNSTYNIVCGRSRNVTGPFYDNMGRDMMAGGGKMVIAAENRRIGAGHFGRTIVEEGVEKMSLHWEADMDQSGRSVLAIRPIVWVNDWPVSGGVWEDGEYAIISERRGYALELAVDFVRLGGGMRGFGGSGNDTVVKIEDQKLEDVIGGWPKGEIDARIGDIMYRPHQKWSIESVEDVPGYLGGLYCKIVIDGTNRALAAAPGAEVVTVPEFTGAPEQLWRIDMLTDGTYRIMPKEVPGEKGEFVLISAGDSTPSLGKFDFNSDNCKWNLKKW